MDEQINVEPGVKGIIVKAKAKTDKFYDWILIISHVESRVKDIDYMIYCHACICLNYKGKVNICDAMTIPMGFGLASHYNFYKPTYEEINMMKEFLKQKNLKFIKGINKMFDR